MALNLAGPLGKITDLLEGLSGIQAVYRGVPENIGSRVSAYVTLGGQTVDEMAFGVHRRRASYFIAFVYRIQGAEADAENALCSLLDAFIAAVLADPTLGGTVWDSTLDLSLASDPRYQLIAGQEFRLYPLLLTVEQEAS